jgi:hypothetical protein
VSSLNGAKSSSGCTYVVPLVDYGGKARAIRAVGVNKIARMKEGVLPSEMESIFPKLAGKTAGLRQKKGKMDILAGLDNSRWMPYQARNNNRPPSIYRLMKSQFGKRYMVMGSGQEECGQRKTKNLVHTTLRGFRKGMMALVMIMMAASPGEGQEVCRSSGGGSSSMKAVPAGCGCSRPCGGPADPRIVPLWWILGIAALVTALVLTPKSPLIRAWFILYYFIMSPIRWVRACCEKRKDSEDWDSEPRPAEEPRGITFTEWPPALQMARLRHEARCRAFLADNRLRKKEYMKELQAGTRLHPDNEKEENIPVWELWPPK